MVYTNIFQRFKSWMFNPYNAELILFKALKPKGFSQFESIINVLVSSFWFIWIPVLWVYVD